MPSTCYFRRSFRRHLINIDDLLAIVMEKESLRPAPEGRQPPLSSRLTACCCPERYSAHHPGRNAVHGVQHDDQPAEAEIQGNRRAGHGLRRRRPGPLPRQRLPAARQRRHGAARNPHQDSHHRGAELPPILDRFARSRAGWCSSPAPPARANPPRWPPWSTASIPSAPST